MSTEQHALWERPGLTIRAEHVSAMDNVCYLLTCASTGAQALVDAADDAPRLLALASAHGNGRLDLVITTHRHGDHHRALADVVAGTGARTAAGRDDAPDLPVAVTDLLDGGDAVRFGDVALDVVALRGHTPGSVALVHRAEDTPPVVLTGDSLFPGGVGNTSGPADFEQLLADVTARLFDVLPDETLVLPGHGLPTTLRAERPHLQEWAERGW